MALTTLDQLAERIAPTKATTNYFDPGPGQSVMSRYANAGRRLEDSKLVSDASSRLLQSRSNLLADRRDQVKMDREDEEYEDYKGFKLERSKFVDTISNIRPDAEDFETQLSEIYKTLPASAAQDPLVMDLLESKKRVANDFMNERQAQVRRDEEQANRLALMKERYNRDPRLAALTPEERDQFYTPDGDFDSIGAAQLAYQKSRQDKKTDQVEVAKAKADLKKLETADDKTLSGDERALKTLAKEHAQGDPVAFPDQVDLIREKVAKDNPTKTGKALEDLVKKDPNYAKFKDYESNKFVSEMESARNMTEAEYVSKPGDGLNEKAKDKRRTVWKAANPGGQAAPAPVAPAAPLPESNLVVGKRYRGADGSIRTFKGNGQWE